VILDAGYWMLVGAERRSRFSSAGILDEDSSKLKGERVKGKGQRLKVEIV
jgi:hypothetical protein